MIGRISVPPEARQSRSLKSFMADQSELDALGAFFDISCTVRVRMEPIERIDKILGLGVVVELFLLRSTFILLLLHRETVPVIGHHISIIQRRGPAQQYRYEGKERVSPAQLQTPVHTRCEEGKSC